MGLIKAISGATGGVLGDQWREYFYCDALPTDVLVTKGLKRTSGRSSNTRGSDNIISSGSVIAVADGQCMLIVEQGKVVEICAEPGEFTFDASSEPSIFSGSLSQGIPAVFANIGKRFTFGGEAPMDQRVYYFNTKELIGNKYGTPSPVPFRVVDQNIGLDIDISIRCSGEYSFRITNPILFYTNVCGNVEADYTREQIESQLKSELLTALQPAFAKISTMGIRYSMLPAHTTELSDALNEVLSSKWSDLRGLEIVSFGVSTVKASDEDEAMIKELQRNATFRDPTMAAAQIVGAQSTAMQDAARNEGAGAPMAFVGMNMASNAGGASAQNLFAMGQQQQQQQQEQQQQATQADTGKGWVCSCGHTGNTGKFCAECGTAQPQTHEWTCKCGHVNQGKFCSECGEAKPAGALKYKCDKCGWEPEDASNPPKFCPECGDKFDESDTVQ
ncbi:MAG: SPFH domain-containing protein [Oscillospiraceae bacterium]|nr:SPFH domain-containing protein [Oscillospiraceae bacterium]